MNAYSVFLHIHSGLRYVVLLLVLLAIIRAWADWFGRKAYSEGNRKLNLFALISVHTQLLFGIVLYFLSPFVQFNSGTMKNFDSRYWTVEHLTMMIIAIALITVGHSRSKKIVLPEGKHKTIALYYTAALLIIVVAIVVSHRSLLGMTS
ncbi:MAG: cytochrome [Mucilaginibacter sp.]|nr:cytochrome [Mucilaginibacter sp.]